MIYEENMNRDIFINSFINVLDFLLWKDYISFSVNDKVINWLVN